MGNLKKKHIALPIMFGALTPSLVIFSLEVFVGNYSPVKAIIDILSQQFARGHNLFLIMLWGLIPFAILMLSTALFSRSFKGKKLDCIFYGGLVGILGLMILGHFSVWFPLYARLHMHSTAVIAFFFIPFFCIVTMGIGLLIGWLISKSEPGSPARGLRKIDRS